MPSDQKSSRRRLISSSDEDSGPSRRKSIRKLSLSAEKKSRVTTQLETDSESENDGNENTGIQMGSRSSERLHKRYSRSFQMPSRDSVWSDIPTTPASADKAIGRLKTKKSVHNFTRITHRYNQDLYNSDDDDSSTDDFVVSDGTVSEEEENVSSEAKEVCESDKSKINYQKKHRAAMTTAGRHHRVKGYHSKIRGAVSSSSESDNEGITTSFKNSDCNTVSAVNDDQECDRPGDNSSGVNNVSETSRQCKQSGEPMCGRSTPQHDQDDIEWELRSKSCRAKRRQSRIESSSDSDQSTKSSAKGTQPGTDSEITNENNSEQLSGDVDAFLNSNEQACRTASYMAPENSAENSTENQPKCTRISDSASEPGSKCTRISDSEHETGSKSAISSDSNFDSDSNNGYTSNSDSQSSGSGQDNKFDIDNIKSSRARHQIQKQESAKKKKFEAFLEARRKLSASKRK